jgi:RluA family pseudouridine synthase
VLHDDADLVAVAKPPGLPVIPARGEEPDACLRRRLEAQLGSALFVVHRIDRDASGLVLFARHAEAHRALSLAFERRQVAKHYVAYLAGALEPPAGRIETPLHAARRGKTRPARPGEPGARAAVTEYATEAAWRLDGRTVSRVAARPLTGRHHQLRVHLRSRGAPILWDPLYARGPEGVAPAGAPCARLALHARRIELGHPVRGGTLALEAPLAADLVALDAWLARAGTEKRE